MSVNRYRFSQEEWKHNIVDLSYIKNFLEFYRSHEYKNKFSKVEDAIAALHVVANERKVTARECPNVPGHYAKND